MSKVLVLAVAAGSLLSLSQFALAEDPSTRADRKITGQYFRPHSASTYHQGAISHAEALHYYGRRYNQIPADTAREHAGEIRRNLNTAKKEYGKLQKEAKDDKKLQEHLKAIEAHQMKAEAIIAKLEKGATEGKSIAAWSKEIAKELKAAEAENEKLMKTLGVAKPAAAKSGK